MPDRLTAAELGAIRERESKATKGPWFADYHPQGPCGAKCYSDAVESLNRDRIVERPNAAYRGPGKAAREQEFADGKFCAAARTDIPSLLATIDAMQKDIDHLAAVIHEACEALRHKYLPPQCAALFQAEEEYHRGHEVAEGNETTL